MKRIDYTLKNWNFINMNSPADLHCELTGAPCVRLSEYDRCRDGHCLLSTMIMHTDCFRAEAELLEMQDGAGIGFYYGDGCWDSYLLLCVLPDRVEVRTPSRVPNGDTFRWEGTERYWILCEKKIRLKTPLNITLQVEGQMLYVESGERRILSADFGCVRFCTKAPRILLKALNENNGHTKTSTVFGEIRAEGTESGRTMTGICLDRDSGTALEGASVHLAGYANFWATTDGGGAFHIAGVPYGHYTLITAREGASFSRQEIDWQGENLSLSVAPASCDSLRRDAVSGELENDYEKIDLNGVWSFRFDREEQGEKENWQTGSKAFGKCIRVPYPWTSLAAFGEEFLADEYSLHQADTFFCNRWETGETAWYLRRVSLPRQPRQDEILTLCIGAVGGIAKVWFDGIYLGNTLDSYNRFTFPVSDLKSTDGHILAIKVTCMPNSTVSCTGKQDFWFTACPGIWQGVWMEYRPQRRISDLLTEYRLDGGSVTLSLVSVCEQESTKASEASVTKAAIRDREDAEFHIPCGKAGIYRVEIEYCAGSGRVAALVGEEETSVLFEATPDFTHFDRKHFYLRLRKGMNRVRFKKREDRAMPGEPRCVIRRALVSPADFAGNVRAAFCGKEVSAAVCLDPKTGIMAARFSFTLHNPALWTKEHPHLYRITAKVGNSVKSEVSRTLGIRIFAPGQGSAANCLYWNGVPTYIRGVLDQGYNPWGLYTYTDTCSGAPGSMDFDLKEAAACGYNLIRMHIKDNEPDWYSQCDRRGMLVWDELPVNFYAKSSDPCWRGMYFRQLGAMARKHNYHPCVVIFSAFNESWGITGGHEKSPWEDAAGQDFIRLAAAEYKKRCRTALVVDNSGYGKTEQTDIIDYHCYPIGYSDSRDFWERLSRRNYPGSHFNFYHEDNGTLMRDGSVRDLLQRNCSMDLRNLRYVGKEVQNGQPVLISEFVHTDGNEQLVRIFPQFAGFIRMNLASQENEDTSPLTSVRTKRDFGYIHGDFTSGGYGMINGTNLLYPDAPRLGRAGAGETVSIDLYAAVWRPDAEEQVTVNWWLTGIDGLGNRAERIMGGTWECRLQKYAPEKAGTVEFAVPRNIRAAYLFLTLSDANGILAENEIQFEISGAQEAAAALELHPASAVESRWSGPEGRYHQDGRELAWGDGTGSLTYRLTVPENYIWDETSTYWLIFEASSCECLNGTRLTDEKFFPSAVQVKVNHEILGSAVLPDHPYDERAVFSNAAAMDSSGYLYSGTGRYGYGFRVKFPIGASPLRKIEESGSALVEFEAKDNGLILYGHRMGRYGCNPVFLTE